MPVYYRVIVNYNGTQFGKSTNLNVYRIIPNLNKLETFERIWTLGFLLDNLWKYNLLLILDKLVPN